MAPLQCIYWSCPLPRFCPFPPSLSPFLSPSPSPLPLLLPLSPFPSLLPLPLLPPLFLLSPSYPLSPSFFPPTSPSTLSFPFSFFYITSNLQLHFSLGTGPRWQQAEGSDDDHHLASSTSGFNVGKDCVIGLCTNLNFTISCVLLYCLYSLLFVHSVIT